jgi:DNA uptake protein ComE-like DNA-binding protein
MNLQPFNRRQDLPVRLGSHGYHLDGDYAFLNAELHLPPYFSEQGFGLELWACHAPHAGGTPDGVKVAEISLELPTPIGEYLHRVEARAALTPPLGDGEHSLVLVLVGGEGDARRVHDFANYSELQHFASPRFDGAVGYGIEGDEVLISAQSVVNSRPEGNTSGSLSLELWASSEPYVSGAPRGYRLAGAELGSIFGQYQLPDVERRVAFTAPPAGSWHVALLLREWTVAQGYVTRDARVFDLKFEQLAPVEAPAPAAVIPATAPAASTPANVANLRSVKAPEAKAVETKAPEAKAADVKAPEAKAVETKAPEAKAADVKAPEVKAVDVKGAEAKAADVKAPEAKAVEAKAPEAKAVEVKAPEAKAADVKAPETKAPEAKAANTKAPEAKAVEVKAPEAKAAEVKAPESKVVETKAPEAKAVETKVAAPEAKASVETPAPATGATSKALVSINTASLDELSRLPGLSLKVAKEIAKNRPFTQVDALVDVRGVGDKILRRIKPLLTL